MKFPTTLTCYRLKSGSNRTEEATMTEPGIGLYIYRYGKCGAKAEGGGGGRDLGRWGKTSVLTGLTERVVTLEAGNVF